MPAFLYANCIYFDCSGVASLANLPMSALEAKAIATLTASLPNLLRASSTRPGLNTLSPLSFASSQASFKLISLSAAIIPVRYKRVVKSDTFCYPASKPPPV